MTVYISQGNYSRDAIVGMIERPEDRAKAVAALAEAVGGKLLDYYVTFGDSDFMVIIEGGEDRDESDTMAALMVAAATGGVANLRTTVAVRSDVAKEAMQKAQNVMAGFRAAGQQG